jgi:hypothetical protein
MAVRFSSDSLGKRDSTGEAREFVRPTDESVERQQIALLALRTGTINNLPV